MTSLGFLGLPLNLAPPQKKINILLSPPNYFGLKFLGPLPKIRGKGGGGGLLPLDTYSFPFLQVCLLPEQLFTLTLFKMGLVKKAHNTSFFSVTSKKSRNEPPKTF